MADKDRVWVAVVYYEGDKVDSKQFLSDSEEEARETANSWVASRWGDGIDWSLHRVVPN